MILAVVGGKGHAGKTLIAANLFYVLEQACYICTDCKEPGVGIFLKTQPYKKEPVLRSVPYIHNYLCAGCRYCVDFCHYDALRYIEGRLALNRSRCAGCGGCVCVCPLGAITEKQETVALIDIHKTEKGMVLTSKLMRENEVIRRDVFRKMLEIGEQLGRDVIVDCMAGTSELVMDAMRVASVCLLVVEPSVSAKGGTRRVIDLANCLGVTCLAVVNKTSQEKGAAEAFCQENDIMIVGRIPGSRLVAAGLAKGELPSQSDPKIYAGFQLLWRRIQKAVST